MEGMKRVLNDTKKEKEDFKQALPLQILNVVSFIGVVIVNVLNTTGGMGESNTVISDRYPTLITPDGYAFSIWGVIYLFNALFLVYQSFPSQRSNPVVFRDLHLFFFLANLFNFTWTILFSYEQIWASPVIISLILLSLLIGYVRVGVGLKKATPVMEYVFVHLNLSFYSAWLSLATVLNWAVALKGKGGWTGEPWTEEGWAILMMGVITLITLIILAHRNDGAFGIIVSWGLFGIANARKREGSQGQTGSSSSDPSSPSSSSSLPPVALAAFVFASFILVSSVLALAFKAYKWTKERKEEEREDGSAEKVQTSP